MSDVKRYKEELWEAIRKYASAEPFPYFKMLAAQEIDAIIDKHFATKPIVDPNGKHKWDDKGDTCLACGARYWTFEPCRGIAR